MPILINGKTYPENTRFRIALDPEFKVLSSIDTDKREITYLSVNFLQHGFTIIDEGMEEKIKSIYVEKEDTRTPFYQMHIYKTSGLSTKLDIIDSFHNRQVYANFIGLVDDEQMLKSSFITGHFASYPIDLFNNFNKKLHSFTLVRDPIQRVVSHYLYESRISSSKSTHSIDNLYNFIENNLEILTDLQTKNITSSMDKDLANSVASNTLGNTISLSEAFSSLGSTSRFLSKNTKENEWKNHLDKFSLIGTVDDKTEFTKNLYRLLNSEGYFQAPKPEYNINKNFVSTKDFIKTLPNELINKIQSINQNDISMYEYVKSFGVYNGK
jgi:hypothetical protein